MRLTGLPTWVGTTLLLSAITLSGAASAADPQTREPTAKDRLDQAFGTVTGDPTANADIDMKHVLDALADLKPKPFEELSPEEARKQPNASDAVKHLLEEDGKPSGPPPGVTAEHTTYEGAGGKVDARVYRPEGAKDKALPVILYFRGGGFVIADLDTYDASARALAKMTNAIVVSADYRRAPENKFPAAHDDALAAYKWVLANAADWGGDPKRIALAGESAGGNLAINTAIAARDQNLQAPVYQLLVYPVAGVDMNTPSYEENANAKPLNKAKMEWFFSHAGKSAEDKKDPRLDIVGKAKLAGLPPTTVITAEIDPLRSEGQMLAAKLKDNGVAVKARDYKGVTHEFFGMGVVVKDAQIAEQDAADDLKAAFGGKREAAAPKSQEKSQE